MLLRFSLSLTSDSALSQVSRRHTICLGLLNRVRSIVPRLAQYTHIIMSAIERPVRPGVRHNSSTSQLLGASLELQNSRSSATSTRRPSLANKPSSAIAGVARHTLGLLLLLVVVFLWTASNFLGSVTLTHSFLRDSVIDYCAEHLCRQYLCKTVLFDVLQYDMFHPRHVSRLD